MSSAFAKSGPFDVAVDEWIDYAGGAKKFAVLLSAADGCETVVFRTYAEFEDLAKALQLRRSLRAPAPRGFCRRLFNCGFSAGFMERQRRGLDAFLKVAVAADPRCLNSAALRAFLGLPAEFVRTNEGSDCSTASDEDRGDGDAEPEDGSVWSATSPLSARLCTIIEEDVAESLCEPIMRV